MTGGSHPSYPTCQVGPTRPTPHLPNLSGGSHPPYPTPTLPIRWVPPPYPTCQVGPTGPTLPHPLGGSYRPHPCPTPQVGPTRPTSALPHLPGGSHPPYPTWQVGPTTNRTMKIRSQNTCAMGLELMTSPPNHPFSPLPLDHLLTCVNLCVWCFISLTRSCWACEYLQLSRPINYFHLMIRAAR
jgi:hypothetical protein